MDFWILTTALSAVIAGLLVLALLRRRESGEPAAAYDLRVYRDQLAEIDRDLARGVIAEADAERVRTEVARRILAADAALHQESVQDGKTPLLSHVMAGLVVVGLIGGGYVIYRDIGAPGYGDLALADRLEMAERLREDRPSQADAEAQMPERPAPALSPDYVALLERLRRIVAERPDDLQGHLLLARNEATAGNFVDAHQAQSRVIEIKGLAANGADYADLAELLILAAGGYVSPEAEAALASALDKDPANGAARYYWGLMMGQTGRPDVAFRVWDRLLRDSPADALWVEPIRVQIEEMAVRAGVTYTPPAPRSAPPLAAPPPGPTAEDIDAASELSAEDRLAMIEGMVSGLADRLATEGGPPEDWARLITSLGVLGRRDEALAIYQNAREVFADAPGAMDQITRAAEQAGVGE